MGQLLGESRNAGSVAICGAVFAELSAHPLASAQFIEKFLTDTEVQIDFDLSEVIWRDIARVYADYVERRRRSNGAGAKRLLVDFVVGAHALHRADRLLTLDASRYQLNFPNLVVLP